MDGMAFSRIEDLESELKKKIAEMINDESTSENGQLTEISRLRRELDEERAVVRRLQQNQEQAKVALGDKEIQIIQQMQATTLARRELSEMAESCNLQRDELERRLARSQEEEKRWQGEVQSLQKERADHVAKIKDLETFLHDETRKLMQSLREQEHLQTEITRFESTVRNLIEQGNLERTRLIEVNREMGEKLSARDLDIEALREERVRSRVEFKKLREQIQARQAETNRLEGEVQARKEAMDKLRTEIRAGQKQIQDLKDAKVADAENFRRLLTESDRTVDSLHQRVRDLVSARVTLEQEMGEVRQNASAQMRVAVQLVQDEAKERFERVTVAHEDEKNILLNRLQAQDEEGQSAKALIAGYESQIADMQERIRDAHERAQRALAESDLKMRERESELQAEIECQRTTHERSVEDLRVSYLNSLEGLRHTHAGEISELNFRMQSEIEFANTKATKVAARAEETERFLRNAVEELRTETTAASATIAELKNDISKLVGDRQKRDELIDSLRQQLREEEVKISARDAAMEQMSGRFEGLEARHRETCAELNSVNVVLKSRESRLNADICHNEELKMALVQRETQLRRYADGLNRDRAEISMYAQQLAQEIRSAKIIHPLKDYLALTEFELSKIEVQLKAAPTISLLRPHLEKSLAQLVEQREFLRHSIETAQRQLDQQADQVMGMVKGDRAAPVPPPPSGLSSKINA